MNLKQEFKLSKRSTILVMVSAVIFVGTLFVDQAEVLGISVEIVRWISFGISALTGVVKIVTGSNNEEELEE